MPLRRLNAGFLILEAINAFATAYYFNYLFFYLQKQFGFGAVGNLSFSALNGFVYIFSSLYGGRFAQKHGYFLALNIGFAGMAAALVAGLFLPTVPGQLLVLLLWAVAICFTWPTLEALVTEGEDWRGLPRIVGIYNMVWASGTALAFFTGGALVQLLGWKSVFWLPAGLHVVQLGLTAWLAKKHELEPVSSRREETDGGEVGAIRLVTSAATAASGAGVSPAIPGVSPAMAEVHLLEEEGSRARHPLRAGETPAPRLARTFLRMAWAANPLAYVAINTALPLMPEIAQRLKLSPMLAGFVCSVFMFARLGAFLVLWLWTGWHYRFGWLLSSYLLLIASFAGLLLAPYLWAVVLAQIVFGWAIGLIYYSSLFYSMDASETKGVHGGVHEAAIGVGIFTGPALGAFALMFFPQQVHVSAWTVSCLLVSGFFLLVGLKRSSR